jgi:hypothetical protein
MERSALLEALERYYTTLNLRDPAALAAVLDPDVVFDDDALRRQVIRGADAMAGAFAAFWQAMPDLTFTIIDGPFPAEAEPRCALHVRLTGTLAQPVPQFGWTKVGGQLDLEFMAVYRFNGDRVAHIRVCADPTVMAGQLAD